MYRRKVSGIAFKNSVSPLPNNLSVRVDTTEQFIYYAAVSSSKGSSPAGDSFRNEVSLLITSVNGANVALKEISTKEPAYNGTRTILQVRVVPVADKLIVVVTSRTGVQMFDVTTTNMIFYYSHTDSKTQEKTNELNETFCRGICAVADSMIVVGTHAGELLVFSVPQKGTAVKFVTAITDAHKAAVVALESVGNKLVSSDDLGTVNLWNFSGEKFVFNKTLYRGTGAPCTSVVMWSNVLVGAFGSGHIRVFDTVEQYMVAEVAAHARWINALDVAPNTGLLLSASEDTFIRVWQLNQTTPQITHLESICVTDRPLHGAGFIDSNGRAFACSSYDFADIVFYEKKQP